MKWYMGYRTHEGDPIVCVRGDSGPFQPFLPDLSLTVRNHSPDGFEWGYGGSGPAQLALALLLDALDDPYMALALYQDFKWKHVGAFDRQEWSMTQGAIQSWAKWWLENRPDARERYESQRFRDDEHWERDNPNANPSDREGDQ